MRYEKNWAGQNIRLPDNMVLKYFCIFVSIAISGSVLELGLGSRQGSDIRVLGSNRPYKTSGVAFSKIVWFALPFMALISFLILYFFWFKLGL